MKYDTLHEARTPEGIAYTLSPAGPVVRFCAFLIDGVISWCIYLAVITPLQILSRFMGIWLLQIVLFLFTWFYHVFFELAGKGQSPGKKIMGLRTVMSDGSPVSPGASFMRNLLRFADTFMGLYPIALVSMTACTGFRRLGDWAAGTLVMYTESSSLPLHRTAMPWLDRVPPMEHIPSLSCEEKQAVLSFARRYPLLGKARASEIAAILKPALATGFAPEPACIHDDADYLLAIASRLAGSA